MTTYADVAALKRSLGIDATDTSRDEDLLLVLEAATAEIDAETERTFQPYLATRTYTYTPGGWGVRYEKPLWVADLLTVTSLVVEGTTWTAADYVLLPDDAPGQQRPYTRIARSAAGSYVFSTLDRAIVITGLWGFWEDLKGTGATLGADVTSGAATLTASAGGTFSPGQTLRIDDEQVYLTGVDGVTLTVDRGVNGTTAAAHLTGAAIRRYAYPRPIIQETLARSVVNHRTAEPAGIQRLQVGDFAIQYGDPSGDRARPTRDRLIGYRRRAMFA